MESTPTQLLAELTTLVDRDRKTTSAMLVCIEQMDRHSVWATLGYPSMFALCTQRFHMSESQAAKRIWAARTARNYPVLLEMIENGQIHLSAVMVLSKCLTQENHREVLDLAIHKSKRECEELAARYAPKPDVPTRVVRVPTTDAPSLGLTFPSGAPTPKFAAPSSPPPQAVTPLSAERYKLQVTIGKETHDKLRALQELLSHAVPGADAAEIIDRALSELLEKTLRKKAAQTQNPRPQPPRSAAETTRTIPAQVRREVWQRDSGQCAFIGADGHRCGARRLIEFHHCEPFARGGPTSTENISLRCAAHNRLHAEQDYGASFMDDKRARRAAALSQSPT